MLLPLLSTNSLPRRRGRTRRRTGGIRHFKGVLSPTVTATIRLALDAFKVNPSIPVQSSSLLLLLLLVSAIQLSWTALGATGVNPFSQLIHANHTIPSHLHNPHRSVVISQHHSAPVGQQATLATPPTNTNHLHQRRPDSSSSFFADIEDLNDSSVRIRLGAHQQQPPGEEQDDFDQLIERILQPFGGHGVFSPQQQVLVNGFNGHGSTVAADANNKTTMRFFRNNKTFASIVYTNNAPLPSQPAPPAEQVASSAAGQTGTQPGLVFNVRQPRKLINCHLVDLEKHSSDVALFEAKYEIKTVDIEFNEMMQIIESCTNIARFKPLKSSAAGSSTAAQLFAASLPASPLNKGAFRPLLVVGRPMAAPTAADRRREHLEATFRALDSHLAGAGEPPRLQVQQQQPPEVQLTQPQRFKRLFGAAGGPEPERVKRPGLLVQALARVAEPRLQALAEAANQRLDRAGAQNRADKANKKTLVLGEVTPSAQAVANKTGGIKEALQEITSYDTTDLMSIWRGILPGTNWCGMGDRATSYNDLGFESDIDICCRAHDFCPIRLSAFSAGYGLFNWSFYTRSHCRCDQNFLDCLQRAESPLSSVVLRFYFTIMKTTCLHDNERNNAAAAKQQQQEVGKWSTTSGQQQQQTARQRQPPSSIGMDFSGSSMAAQQQQQQVAAFQSGQIERELEAGSSQSTSLQRRLLDQLRASLPIPALRMSQTIRTELESQQKQQQQQQPAPLLQSAGRQRNSNKKK